MSKHPEGPDFSGGAGQDAASEQRGAKFLDTFYFSVRNRVVIEFIAILLPCILIGALTGAWVVPLLVFGFVETVNFGGWVYRWNWKRQELQQQGFHW